MSKFRLKVVNNVEDNSNGEGVYENPTRPFYDRPPGCVGIYVDVYTAEERDPDQSSLHHAFLMHVGERLLEPLQNMSFHIIKGAFERKNMLKGVIFEKVESGIVFTVSCESVQALEQLWEQYDNDLIGPVMQATLVTPALEDAVEAKNLVLRTRMYEDEVDACRPEVGKQKITDDVIARDREMLQHIREYQRVLAEKLLVLKDDCGHFDAVLGDFTTLIKRSLPNEVHSINTYNEFLIRKATMEEKKVNTRTLNAYIKVREELKNILNDIEENICHRLPQIHTRTETDRQKKNKLEVIERSIKCANRLRNETDISKVVHSDWAAKIVKRDHKLFLGLVSVIALGMDDVIEIDQLVDEYLSGFSEYKF